MPFFALKGQPQNPPGAACSAALALVTNKNPSPERATQLIRDVSPLQSQDHQVRVVFPVALADTARKYEGTRSARRTL